MSSGLVLGSILAAKADGGISFRNIYYQSPIGIQTIYIYQPSGEKVGPPYVAQLYLLKDDWVAISKPATFSSSGGFNGGNLTIPGDYGGKAVTFQVRVWNGEAFANYDLARRAASVGESEPFTETLVTPPERPQGLLNLKSFRLWTGPSCNFLPTTVYDQITIHEGESIPVHVDVGDCADFQYRDVSALIAYNQNPTGPIIDKLPGLSLGTLHGVRNPFDGSQFEEAPFTYVSSTNFYGTDYIYSEICCGFGGQRNYGSRAIAVTIQPSEARQQPTLFIPAPKKVALLGLNGRRYRIDRSFDLESWTQAATLTGNYSTVDLTKYVINKGTSTQFLRATDVTIP